MVTNPDPFQDQTQSGFRDWTLGKCRQFLRRWEENETRHAEQAALAATCEEYGVDYMSAEWVDIAVKVKEVDDPNGIR